MKLWELNELPNLPKMKLAVVGHVEWVTFLSVDKLPKPGIIGHAQESLEAPAGGGAVAAVQLSRIIDNQIHFFTALGKDELGKKSFEQLSNLGLKMCVAWRDKPTRKGISLVDNEGDRAITVIGERLQPSAKDPLPWNDLNDFDGVFVTATDVSSMKHCRKARVMTATPRLGLKKIQSSGLILDALIGSGLDPDERVNNDELDPLPHLIIKTEGKMGGQAYPGGDFKAINLDRPLIDAYGCGDSFAAGVTAGLSAGWTHDKAISLGTHWGAKAATYFGPYFPQETVEKSNPNHVDTK